MCASKSIAQQIFLINIDGCVSKIAQSSASVHFFKHFDVLELIEKVMLRISGSRRKVNFLMKLYIQCWGQLCFEKSLSIPL